MLEELTDTPVELGISSEWGYGMPLLSKKPLFIFISQSGETADSRQVWSKPMKWAFQAWQWPMFQDLLFHVKPTYHVAPCWSWNCGRFHQRLIRLKSQPLPFWLKLLGKPMAMKGQSLWFGARIVYRCPIDRIQPFQKKKWSTKSSWLVGNNPQCFLYWTWPRLLCCYGSQSETKRNFLHPMWRLRCGWVETRTIALIEEGTPVIALLSDPVLASHTRGNIQEVAARGAHVLTIAEENVAKETDDLVLTAVHPYLSQSQWWYQPNWSPTLQPFTVGSMLINHGTLLSL